MAEKRIVLRHDMSSDFDGDQSAQEDLVDEVENFIDGSGISGFYIAGSGRGWLEWEGEENDVDSAVQDLLTDSRVGQEVTLEESYIDSRNSTTWHGHCEADAYC